MLRVTGRTVQTGAGIKQKRGWLFLSTDEPEIIIELIRQYPEFKEMYEEIYVMCQNVEKVMEMFSKELIQTG